MKNLQEKRILVCGGSTGIGAATVRRLCEEGARIAIGDLNDAGAQALAGELCAAGADVTAWHYDQVSDQSFSYLVSKSFYDHLGNPRSGYGDHTGALEVPQK